LLRIKPIIPAFPTTIIIGIPSTNIMSVWEALGWDFEGETRSCALGGVVDSLQLLEDEVAIRAGEEGAVATERFEGVVVAHCYFQAMLVGPSFLSEEKTW